MHFMTNAGIWNCCHLDWSHSVVKETIRVNVNIQIHLFVCTLACTQCPITPENHSLNSISDKKHTKLYLSLCYPQR